MAEDVTNESVATAVKAEPKQKVEVSIPSIKEDLKNGVTRKEMQEKYGLLRADIIKIFKHPELKGLKVHTAAQKAPKAKRTPNFILKDSDGNDVTDVAISEFQKKSTSNDAVAETKVADKAPVETPATHTHAHAHVEAAQPAIEENSGW